MAGSLTGTTNTSSALVNLTTVGTADWIMWSNPTTQRKAAVSAQISDYTPSGAVNYYSGDARGLAWTDGTPQPTNPGGDFSGRYINYITSEAQGFTFTAPADTSVRTLSVYCGGYNSTGTFTATLSDGSAAPYVYTTAGANNSYDQNFTLTYNAASAGQTLTITWLVATAGGAGNNTLNGAALSIAPSFTLTAVPSSLTVEQGETGQSAITVNPLNGFTGTVAFSATGLPSGVTAAFNPSSSTSGTEVTFTASSSAALGTTTVEIVGTSGALTYSVPIALTIVAPPSFTLSASPSSLSIVQGNTGQSAITVDPAGGFTGSVTFSASGLPSGVTAAFNPSSSTGGTEVTFTVASGATPGEATVEIIGTSGALTAQTPIALTVVHSPEFTLSADPSAVSIVQGETGNSVVSVDPEYGFSGTVAFSATGLPSGVTAAFNPSSSTSETTVTFTVSSSATPGETAVEIVGTSGSLTAQTPIALTVVHSPTFTLSANPTSLNITQGQAGDTLVTVNPEYGFDSAVTFSASGLPAGVTAGFNPASSTSECTVTFSVSSTATPGTTTVEVIGVSGALTESTPVALTISVPQSFALSASPNTLSIAQGGSGQSAVTVTPAGGFAGNVTFSATGLPSGVTATFSPSSSTTGTTVTFTASSGAALGTATVEVVGTSGALTAQTPIAVTITNTPTPPSPSPGTAGPPLPQAIGVYEGAFASWPISQNLEARAPFRSVNAGVGAWTSDPTDGGVLQGRFAWGNPATGTAQNTRVTSKDTRGIVIPFRSLNGANGGVVGGPRFLAGWQASYTWEFYDPTATPNPFGGLRVRPGLVVTMHDRGNFWLRFAGGAIAGNTVYASLVDGSAVSGLPSSPPANCEATAFKVCFNITPGQLGIVSSSAVFSP